MKVLNKFLSTLLTCLLILNTFYLPNLYAKENINFVDIKGHWANKNIKELIDKGIIKGQKIDEKYYIFPNKNITRAEFLTMLLRTMYSENKLKNIEIVESSKFSDISSHWANKNIMLAKQIGVVGGYPDGAFKPDNNITRAEICSILVGANLLELPTSIVNHKFKDLENSFWGYYKIQYLISLGLLEGYNDDTFKPNKNATRAEAAVIIDRLMKSIKNQNKINEKNFYNKWIDYKKYVHLFDMYEKYEQLKFKVGNLGEFEFMKFKTKNGHIILPKSIFSVPFSVTVSGDGTKTFLYYKNSIYMIDSVKDTINCIYKINKKNIDLYKLGTIKILTSNKDGTKLVFVSNRSNNKRNFIQLFLLDTKTSELKMLIENNDIYSTVDFLNDNKILCSNFLKDKVVLSVIDLNGNKKEFEFKIKTSNMYGYKILENNFPGNIIN